MAIRTAGAANNMSHLMRCAAHRRYRSPSGHCTAGHLREMALVTVVVTGRPGCPLPPTGHPVTGWRTG